MFQWSGTLRIGFGGDTSRDVGMYSLASALASHQALQNLTFHCPDVLDAPLVSRLCIACVRLTKVTFNRCRMNRDWVPGLGELLSAATSLSSLVVITPRNNDFLPFIEDDADGDSSVVEPLCFGLASSRSLFKLVLDCGLGSAPHCLARVPAALVAHPSLKMCDFRGRHEARYHNALRPACPQLGQALGDVIMACKSPDVPLRSLTVPALGKGEAAADVELAPLFRALLSAASSPSNGLTSLEIEVASVPFVAFLADLVLSAVRVSSLTHFNLRNGLGTYH